MTREFVAWAILYALRKVRASQKLLMIVNQAPGLLYFDWVCNFGQTFPSSETHPNVTSGSVKYSAKVLVKDLTGSQWFLVLPENQFRPLYHNTWYIFDFG